MESNHEKMQGGAIACALKLNAPKIMERYGYPQMSMGSQASIKESYLTNTLSSWLSKSLRQDTLHMSNLWLSNQEGDQLREIEENVGTLELGFTQYIITGWFLTL